MTQRNNHLQHTHGPRTAARALASDGLKLRGLLAATLAIASPAFGKLITVLVLITSPTSAEYGFV